MNENRILDAAAAASDEVGYRDPEWHPPPRGLKLLLLTEGGVAVIGTWADGAGFVAWSYLPTKAVRRAAQPSADLWRDAVEQMLATTEQVASDDPRESLDRLINWHVSVALDPLVSSDARALVQRGRDEADLAAALQPSAIVSTCDDYPQCERERDRLTRERDAALRVALTYAEANAKQAQRVMDLAARLDAAQPSAEPSELVRAARDAVTIPRIVAEQALRYVETGDPHGRLRVLDALRRALDATPETGEARDAGDSYVLQLLLAAGHVTPEKVEQARAIGRGLMGDAPEAKGGGR